ncbi:MAG: molybdopterin-guanine dinucleotide biosynthesis protein MobC [Anaerolinea sp.]|nr:molybdopterin-guanine dinucleotide biosynthesis protein MobC [Anaerolinea sp.]
MNIEDIKIQHGLPSEHIHRAVEIYYEAFRRKLDPTLGSQEHSLSILTMVFEDHPDLAIVALHQAKIVGVTGLQVGGRGFFNFKWSYFTRQFGWLRAIPKAVVMYFARRPERSGQLLMNGIAVDPSMRGKGVGTLLLQAVFEFARANCYSTVRLDVVDTNPEARCLYERMGFLPTKTYNYPFLRNIVGFSAETTMIKQIANS